MSVGASGPSPPLLEAARAGDEDAFRRLVEPHRAELHAHCYRMLGSLHDAEDALQDALLRAWRGLAGFEGDRPLRPWLYRIATNACLDAIAKRPRRALPVDREPASAPGDGPGKPSRAGLARAVPGLRARGRERLRGARGSLRAARGGRARFHRGAAASAREPAGGAHPARGPRLLGPRGRGHRSRPASLGEQRAAAGPQDGGRAPSGPQPAGHPPRPGRRPGPGDGRGLRRSLGAPGRGSDGRDARGGSHVRDASAPALVPWPGLGHRVHHRHRQPDLRHVITTASGQPAVGGTGRTRGRRLVRAGLARGPCVGRRSRPRDHCVRSAGPVRALRRCRRASRPVNRTPFRRSPPCRGAPSCASL